MGMVPVPVLAQHHCQQCSLPCRAFFWLVSLLLSSLIWFIAVKGSDPRDEPLQKGLLIFGVMFSVLLQEAFRFLYYKLLR